jgi:hypothetical protein
VPLSTFDEEDGLSEYKAPFDALVPMFEGEARSQSESPA